MKRYTPLTWADVAEDGTPCGGFSMHPLPDGEWVSYEDAQAEIALLRELLLRARKFVEDDTLMIAAITRHAPLPPDAQAIHNSTEYLSEILLRDIDSVLPNAKANGREASR